MNKLRAHEYPESVRMTESQIFDWSIKSGKPSPIVKLLIGPHSTKSDPHPQTRWKSEFKQQILHIQSIPHHTKQSDKRRERESGT